MTNYHPYIFRCCDSMNVLLIKPPSHQAGYGGMIPLGFAYIAAVLHKLGYEITAFDLSMMDIEWERKNIIYTESKQELIELPDKWDRIENKIKDSISKKDPLFIGLTCNTSERFNMFKIAKIAKKYTNCPVVVGGPHVTVEAEQTLSKIPEIDIVVRGEGELTIGELAEKIQNKKGLETVKGISYRAGDKIFSNPDRDFISDLDVIPFPARELFENGIYHFQMPLTAEENNVTGIITSRGCPSRCNYCSGHVMWRRKYRFRSAKNVVDEMEQVLQAYPYYDGFWISDDNFYANKKRAIEICREIKRRKMDFIWGTSGRADMIDSEIAKEMSSAGCRLISFGVESGSEKVLKLMNKEQDISAVKNAVKICKENNIQPRGTFIFGYPGESILDFFKTMKVLYLFEPNSTNYTASVLFYPGTPLTKKFLNDFDWTKELPEDTPRVSNIPMYKHKSDPLRAKLALQMIRPVYWLYHLTHPGYSIKKLKHWWKFD